MLDFSPSELARPLNIKKKSWRSLIQSNASSNDVLPTRVSVNEDAQQARESEENEIEDSDQIKRTRSGKVYFTHTTPIKIGVYRSVWTTAIIPVHPILAKQLF